ncbi:hypothetical protein [Alteromonas stellipolaris]|uniref:Tyr recombinase domain-containing protein n=1 Tax=Alteromonas stellipolaris TaxID=233316 RepID=A0ABN4LS31_9ALTE|nr:hypothetical protein AVL57_00280 [Alteromonas stellipolaris]
MPDKKSISREPSTEEAYQKRVRYLFGQVKKSCSDVSPDSVYEFVSNMIPTKSYSWLRTIKASLVMYYENHSMISEAEKINSLSSDECKRSNLQTSSKKKKNISEKKLAKLDLFFEEKIKTSSDTLLSPAYAFIKATLHCGLRPSEWQSAELVESTESLLKATEGLGVYSGKFPAMTVINGKATNGRSFGKYRILDLSDFTDKQRMFVSLAIYYASGINKTDFDWDAFYNNVRVTINRVISSNFPSLKGLSLYTFRHQCIANLKHAGYSLEEIAVIVGHGTDLTASQHYAKKRYGHTSTNLVKPNHADIPRIKNILHLKLKQRGSLEIRE